MPNEIEVRLASKGDAARGIDETSSAAKRLETTVKQAGVSYRAAQLRVEKATARLTEVQKTAEKGSLKEREALLGVERAQLQADAAAGKYAAAQRKAAAAQDETRKSGGRLKRTLGEVGKGAAAFATSQILTSGAQKLGELFRSTFEAASGLNESMNAVNKVFGSSSQQIQDWGKKNAAAFGLSQRAFNELATPLGAGLKNAGLSLQDTSKWTVELTKRAADMASVFNTSVPDALEAIQAGLRGEADPLERFGVGLSAAAVQSQALAETGKANAKQLTNTELAMARLNLIMKQTASSQGDFAQTSDQAANAQRIASAQIEDAKAKIGQGLLPVMAKLATVSGDAAQKFGDLPGPLQTIATGALVAGGAFILLAPRIRAAAGMISDMGNGVLAADKKLGQMTRTAGKVAGVLVALAAASAAFQAESGAMGADTTRLALDRLRKSGQDSSGTLKDLDYDLRNIGESGRNVGKAVETFTGVIATAVGKGDKTISNVNDRMQSLDTTLATMVSGGHAKEAAEDFQLLADRAEQQGTSVEKLKQFFPQYQNALDHTTNSVKDNTAATKNNTEAQKASASQILKMRGDARGFQAAIDDATQSLKDNGKTLNINTEKGRANQAAIDQIASSTLAWRDSAKEAGQSAAAQNRILEQGRKHLINTARQMGMTRTQAKRLADQILDIPASAKTMFSTPGLSAALSAQRRYEDSIRRINGKTVRVHYRADGSVSIGGARAFAHGGVVGAASGGLRSGLVQVGEHGRELLALPPGTRVHSNPDTERMLTSGPGQSQQVQVTLDIRGADREFVEFMKRIVHARGAGLVQQAFGTA